MAVIAAHPRQGELWHLRDAGLVHTVRVDRETTVITLSRYSCLCAHRAGVGRLSTVPGAPCRRPPEPSLGHSDSSRRRIYRESGIVRNWEVSIGQPRGADGEIEHADRAGTG